MNKVKVFSVFSGMYYDIPEADVKLLQTGHLPLKKQPRTNCKKCYGRGYNGREKQFLSYMPCSCVQKAVDLDILKSLEEQRIKLSK